MKRLSGSPLIKILLSPTGLLIVVGLAGGFFVSDLFRGIAERQAPPPQMMTGPLNASQAPLAYSDVYSPVSDNKIIGFTAEKLLEKDGKTFVELTVRFHRHPEFKFYEIGAYEPPSLVDRNGNLLLGTVNFPADHHFTGGETFHTLLSFPGKPASYPVTLSLFVGERFAGQYHMLSVSMTGLSPSLPSTLSKGMSDRVQ
ncbi:MAG: hypothetical protein M0T83_03950 [Nitrospiraceae bacterium]|nr:hypothetical protein [Nitrospiraceae bacterium]